MTTVFVEGLLQFEFADDWHAVHYDQHPDYMDRLKRLSRTKAVDFVAINSDSTLFLIEAKDFRGHRIENQARIKGGGLAVEVAQKVRDTIAGIVAANHRGNAGTWERIICCLSSKAPPVRVLLWLEDDLPPGPRGRRQNRALVMTADLKKELTWLRSKVFVNSIASGAPEGITVTNLPGAGHRKKRVDGGKGP